MIIKNALIATLKTLNTRALSESVTIVTLGWRKKIFLYIKNDSLAVLMGCKRVLLLQRYKDSLIKQTF